MSVADPHGPAPAGVSALLALVVGAVSFGALAILGLGMLTYFTDTDIISVEGLALWPGIVGMVVAIAVFAGQLWPVLTSPRPAFSAALLVAVVTALIHVAAVWLLALLSGAGLAHATEAASQLILRGSSIVILVVALVTAWIAIALRRSRSGVPQWPWERREGR